MGSKTLIYKQKVIDNLNESQKHLSRLENAFKALEKHYNFPIHMNDFKNIVDSVEHLAYSDQSIYRFSKLQDCMGAKLFKSVLLYEGENINKPFLDILNQLEAIDIDNRFRSLDIPREKMILYVGSMNERKNFTAAIKAFLALHVDDYHLVMVGNFHDNFALTDESKAILSEVKSNPKIRFLPNVSNDELVVLYN